MFTGALQRKLGKRKTFVHTFTRTHSYIDTVRNGLSANLSTLILSSMPSGGLAIFDQGVGKVTGMMGSLSIKIIHVGSYTVQFNIKCNSAKELGSHFNIYRK